MVRKILFKTFAVGFLQQGRVTGLNSTYWKDSWEFIGSAPRESGSVDGKALTGDVSQGGDCSATDLTGFFLKSDQSD